MAALPESKKEWCDETLAERWERLLSIRGEVSKALELARRDKVIGHSLDARVVIEASEEMSGFLKSFEPELNRIFIISKAVIAPLNGAEPTFESEEIKGLKIAVSAASGDKCERCWNYDESTGSNEKNLNVCLRCYEVVKDLE